MFLKKSTAATIAVSAGIPLLGFALYRWWFRPPAFPVNPKSPNVKGNIFKIPLMLDSGETMHISFRRHFVSAQLPTVVLIHGWSGSSDGSWWHVSEFLETNIVAIDLPGHGHSRLPDGTMFTLDLAASAVRRVLGALNISNAIFVGNSMGGPVALLAANHNSARVSAVILTASAASWDHPGSHVLATLAPRLLAPGAPLLRGRFNRFSRMYPDFADALLWGLYQQPSRAVLAESSLALLRFNAYDMDLVLPSLFWIVSSEDGVIRPAHQRASAEFYNAEIFEIEASHAMSFTHAQQIAQIVNTVACSTQK